MKRHIVRLSIDVGGDALPTEKRVFAAGMNDTQKGPVLFDADAAKAVLAAYSKHGVDLPVDYDHAMTAEGSRHEDRKAAAWFDLEVRDGELWMCNIRWTPAAAKGVTDKEWRYFSPAVVVNTKTRRAVELVNVALTNTPATIAAEPLTLSDRRVRLSVSLTEQHEAVRAAIMQWRASAMSERPGEFCVEELFDDAVVYETWEGGERYWRVGYSYDGKTATIEGSPVQVDEKREWVTTPATTDLAASARPATTAGKDPRKEQPRMKTVLAALGLKVDAEEHEAVVALNRIKDDAEAVRTELCSLTGSKNVAEATGKVLAWKASHEKIETLSKRNAELEAERVERDIVAKVDKRIEDGFLTPAKRDEVIKLGREKGVEVLDAMLGCLVKSPIDTTGGADKATVQTVQLSAQQKKLARDAGLSDEEFAKAEVL